MINNLNDLQMTLCGVTVCSHGVWRSYGGDLIVYKAEIGIVTFLLEGDWGEMYLSCTVTGFLYLVLMST